MTDDGITLIDAWELPEDRIDESVARWRERVGLIHTAPGFRDARMHRRRIDEFLPHWLGRAELMSQAPGFRDNRLHRAVNPDTRFQLVNIAHWDSAEAWRAAGDDPRFQQRLSASPDFAAANPALFQVVAEF
ncbi:antibiotic biosynthesis monooxygenase family protein [Nocardia sp. bgisy134]|uniref:antibiotic biosynthesis monooxygenase family protein n=1 Tax=Nocardia sp. bgisy134 TaxID=3413789 RepID=UPI003D738271